MHNHFDICLTHKEIKRFPRKDLENEFMNVQEKVFKQNEEMIKKDQEIIKKDREIQELKEELNQLKKDVESKGIQEVNKLANEPSSKKPEWDKDGNPKKKGKKQKKKNGGDCKNNCVTAIFFLNLKATYVAPLLVKSTAPYYSSMYN